MEKSYVSLEQKLCPICGITHDTNAILLDKRMKNSMEKHTTTGYGNCEECSSKLKQGYIALVEVSNSEKDDKILKQENANRTGNLVWLRKTVCDDIFNVKITTPMVFVQIGVIDMLKEKMQHDKVL